MSQPFAVECPHCDSRLRLRNRDAIGRERRCPSCGERFTVRERSRGRAAGTAGWVKPVVAGAAAFVLLLGGAFAVGAFQLGDSRTTPKADPATRAADTNPADTGTLVAQADRRGARPVAAGDAEKPAGWTQFRGPGRNNISAETGLLDEWPEDGPRLERVIEGLGAGYSTVSLAEGVLYTMGTDGNDEVLLAIDANAGTIKWSRRVGTLRRDGTGDGPRSTPSVDGDHVFGLSANGDLLCANVEDGSVVWQRNILEDFDGRNIGWGISESPLVDGNRVICTPGGSRGTMVALDKRNGETLWTCVTPDRTRAGYASPIVAKFGGETQYVTFAHNGMFGVRASDGRFLWKHSEAANGTANCSTPLPWKDSVFYSSDYGTGGALVRITGSGDAQSAETRFFTRSMKNHHGGMVIVGDHLYGTDGGVLKCIELATGDVAWQSRSVGKGSVVAADGHLYVRSEGGPVALVELDPREYVEKGRFRQPQRSGKSAWAHPVVAGGRLYLRDQDKLLVYDVRE